jgi:hypothetical protein
LELLAAVLIFVTLPHQAKHQRQLLRCVPQVMSGAASWSCLLRWRWRCLLQQQRHTRSTNGSCSTKVRGICTLLLLLLDMLRWWLCGHVQQQLCV